MRRAKSVKIGSSRRIVSASVEKVVNLGATPNQRPRDAHNASAFC